MFKAIVFLIIGMVLLIKGADAFVDGSSGIASKLKISKVIIGLTIVSIGTSLPELSVNVIASIKKMDDIALGNIVGSNIFNIFIVVGLSALIIPLTMAKDIKKYDIPILILIYIILAIFMFVTSPFVLSRIEGAIFLLLTIIYTIFLVLRSKNNATVSNNEANKKWYFYIILMILGLIGIVTGGNMVVSGASYIASYLGLSDLLISLTIVAIGTSLPEVTTSVVAALKKEDDIAIGNAIGSCIYNVILIIGLSALIFPIKFEVSIVLDFLVLSISAIIMAILSYFKKIGRITGSIMIIIYITYLVLIILRNYSII